MLFGGGGGGGEAKSAPRRQQQQSQLVVDGQMGQTVEIVHLHVHQAVAGLQRKLSFSPTLSSRIIES